MPTLHVRSVPDELYERLQSLAQTGHRSLSAEVINLLYKALEDEEVRKQQGRILSRIRRRRFVPPSGAPDSVALLRKDRRR